jgi:hypothetical protein
MCLLAPVEAHNSPNRGWVGIYVPLLSSEYDVSRPSLPFVRLSPDGGML